MTLRPAARAVLFGLVALTVAVALDQWVYGHVVLRGVYDEDLGRLLRVMGFLPTWAIAALALYLVERAGRADAKRRALLLLGSPIVAGIAAELLKLTLRRERPAVLDGLYSWRPFTERPFSTSGLALPSSHTMVAFGAVWMLCRLFPQARWVWITLAVGCGASRVLAQAHFLSDVVLAGLAAFATTAWLWRRWGPVPAPRVPRTTRQGMVVDPRLLSD